MTGGNFDDLLEDLEGPVRVLLLQPLESALELCTGSLGPEARLCSQGERGNGDDGPPPGKARIEFDAEFVAGVKASLDKMRED